MDQNKKDNIIDEIFEIFHGIKQADGTYLLCSYRY